MQSLYCSFVLQYSYIIGDMFLLLIKLLIYAALRRLYLKSDHVFDTVKFDFMTVYKHGQVVVSYIFETY